MEIDPSALMELASIQLKEKVNGTRFLRAGDHVCYEDGWLIESDIATHKVVACYGNISSTILQVMLLDVITSEPMIIDLK